MKKTSGSFWTFSPCKVVLAASLCPVRQNSDVIKGTVDSVVVVVVEVVVLVAVNVAVEVLDMVEVPVVVMELKPVPA